VWHFKLSVFDEIINKLAAERQENLVFEVGLLVKQYRLTCFSWIVVIRCDGSSKNFCQLSGLRSRTLKLLYVFEHQISSLLQLHIFMLHQIVFCCQNCNLYSIINITKFRKDHKVKRWDAHQNVWLITLVPSCHVERSQYSEKVKKRVNPMWTIITRLLIITA